MKLVSALPIVFLIASTALGQHGAPAGRGGGSFSSAHTFSMASPGPARTTGTVSAYHPNLAVPPRSAYTSPIGPPPFGGTQPVPGKRYPYPTTGRRPYYYSRGAYVVPGYVGYAYSGYGYYGYPDDSSYDEQPAAAAAPEMNAQAPTPDEAYQQAYAEVPARPAYQPQAASAPDLPDQPQITVIFKDGRAPQQVQNYAVTRTTLYVLDGARRREIPLDEIDLAQTEKTNRDAGVDFEVPEGAE